MARTLLSEKEAKCQRKSKAVQQEQCKRKKTSRSSRPKPAPDTSDTSQPASGTNCDGEGDCQKQRPGASHRGEILNRWKEDDMLRALAEFNDQKNKIDRLPVRQIARSWNVPYATFRRRIMQHAAQQNHKHNSGRPTVLKKDEEDELVAHIRLLAEVGFPCSRKDVKSLAFEYATKKGLKGFSATKEQLDTIGLSGLCVVIKVLQ